MIENKFERINLKGELKAAILSGDFGKTLRLLERLNDFLVGERGTYQLPAEYESDVEKLVTVEGNAQIFLGDGGMSRLYIERRGNKVEIWLGGGGTASEEVKKRWQELI